jgi:hypothetical protein
LWPRLADPGRGGEKGYVEWFAASSQYVGVIGTGETFRDSPVDMFDTDDRIDQILRTLEDAANEQRQTTRAEKA